LLVSCLEKGGDKRHWVEESLVRRIFIYMCIYIYIFIYVYIYVYIYIYIYIYKIVLCGGWSTGISGTD